MTITALQTYALRAALRGAGGTFAPSVLEVAMRAMLPAAKRHLEGRRIQSADLAYEIMTCPDRQDERFLAVQIAVVAIAVDEGFDPRDWLAAANGDRAAAARCRLGGV